LLVLWFIVYVLKTEREALALEYDCEQALHWMSVWLIILHDHLVSVLVLQAAIKGNKWDEMDGLNTSSIDSFSELMKLHNKHVDESLPPESRNLCPILDIQLELMCYSLLHICYAESQMIIYMTKRRLVSVHTC
jgi:hypothetical protein